MICHQGSGGKDKKGKGKEIKGTKKAVEEPKEVTVTKGMFLL